MTRMQVLVCVMAIGCAVLLRAKSVTADDAVTLQQELTHAKSELSEVAQKDPGFEGVGSDPLSVDPDLALWTLVVFVILLVVLGKFAWGPIIEALERREQNVANHIAEAERNHDEAKALLAEYERKLAGAANDIRELMEEARRDAEHTKQDILAEAKAGAEAERLRALRDIEAATDQALESLAQRSAQLAVDLAGKILQSKLSPADHARLIQEAMAKFPAGSAN